MRLERLLAARLHEVLRRIPDQYAQLVGAFFRERRDIEREGQLAAFVEAYLVVAEIHDGAEIDCAEVQEDALARFRVEVDRARVFEIFIRLQQPRHAGKNGFDCEGDADLPLR